MGFDSNGNWTSDFYPVRDKENGIPIYAEKCQTLIQSNIKQSFNKCLLRNGKGRPMAPINWNGKKITNLSNSGSSNNAVNKGEMDNSVSGSFTSLADNDLDNLTQEGKNKFAPVGSIQIAPLSSLTGYLLCNGQAVSRTTYSALFSAIGTNFGAGDGSTTFNVPDYRGCFLRGFDDRNDSPTAANMYTKQNASQAMVEHYHVFGDRINEPHIRLHITGASAAQTASLISSSGVHKTWQLGGFEAYTAQSSVSGRYITTLPNLTTTQSNQPENRPVNYAFNFFIKY